MARRPLTDDLPPVPDPLAITPEELLRDGSLTVAAAVEFSGICETELKLAIARGEIPTFKRGRIRLIPRRGLALYLARLFVDHAREAY